MMVVQGAHTDPHLPEVLDLIQEQVRAALQAQQQVPATTTAATSTATDSTPTPTPTGTTVYH